MEIIKKVLEAVILLLIFALGYYIETNVDYSSNFFALSRALILGASFAYFYKIIPSKKLLGFFEAKLKGSDAIKWAVLVWFFLSLAVMGLVRAGSETIHQHLLKKGSQEAIAAIKDCNHSGQYCVYSYRIDGRDYEHKFHNYAYQLKNADTISIRYYVANPAISQIDDRYKRK